MKKILLTVVVILTIGLGAFAQNAEYTALLKKAKEYETKKLYVSAMGTYWDAIVTEPTEKGKEAVEAFIKLEEVITNGKPGYGEFDEFSIYDDWVLLLKDAERYFTETPAKGFILRDLKKGDIDRATKTAAYSIEIINDWSVKSRKILLALMNGIEKSRKNDWTEVPKNWPFTSVYAVNFKQGTYLKDGVAIFYQNGDEIKISGEKNQVMGGKRVVAAAFANEAWILSDSDISVAKATKKFTDTTNYMTDAERRSYKMQQGFLGTMLAGQAQTAKNFSLYDITVAIVDENGMELAKSTRILLDENPKQYVFKGISQDVMKLIDGGKAKVVPTGLFLEYGKPNGSGITKDRKWLKPLPEVKFDVAKTTWNQKDAIDVISLALSYADSQSKEITKMITVDGGKFIIGSDDAPNARFPHTVTVSSFMMMNTEVPQWMYFEVMGKNPSKFKGGLRPVEQVSWYDAVEFCNLLSKKEGLKPCYAIYGETEVSKWGKKEEDKWSMIDCDFAANGYRLPTEAEWEFAARGGKNNSPYKYSGSDDLNAVAWWNDNSENTTHTVGKKTANVLGLYDMSGNVQEWTFDYFQGYSYAEEINPVMDLKMGLQRVMRGGAYADNKEDTLIATRYGWERYRESCYNGFRVVRSIR